MEYEMLGDARYHGRKAVRLRELALSVTTGSVKAHLLREAEEHEQLARVRVLETPLPGRLPRLPM